MTLNMFEEAVVELPALPTAAGAERTLEDYRNLSVNRLALDADQVSDLRELFEEFRQCCSSRTGRATLITHEVELTSDKPVQSKWYGV